MFSNVLNSRLDTNKRSKIRSAVNLRGAADVGSLETVQPVQPYDCSAVSAAVPTIKMSGRKDMPFEESLFNPVPSTLALSPTCTTMTLSCNNS